MHRFLIVWAASLAFIACLFVAIPVFAHDAPLGWAYGIDCCSMIDCWQEEAGAIKETPKGYQVVMTGEIIAYSDKRVKMSKDQFYHRCTSAGDPTKPRSICLYVPNKGF